MDHQIKNDGNISRRAFMAGTGVAALMAGGLSGIVPLLPDRLEAAHLEELEMILRRDRPLNLEAPRQALGSWLTPNNLFYVRSHYDNPDVNLSDWRVAIGGEVDRNVDLSFKTIQQLPKVTIVCTLECTGNGRAYFNPQTRGSQWEVGAVGNAVWSGVRLSQVLKGVGVRSSGKFITFKGGEKRPVETVPQFIRSVPIERAMEEVVIAYEMNGEPLPPDHGYPLRAVVPGWYGASSVKWLNAIDVTAEPDSGRYMQKSYRLVLEGQDEKQSAYLNFVNVKSVIAQPGPGTIRAGTVPVQGVAWTGKGEIARVEVSTDGGETWQEAELTGLDVSHAWQTWFYLWDARPGTYTLMCRATDSAGRTQPMQSTWNKKGYGNNAVADHAFQVSAA